MLTEETCNQIVELAYKEANLNKEAKAKWKEVLDTKGPEHFQSTQSQNGMMTMLDYRSTRMGDRFHSNTPGMNMHSRSNWNINDQVNQHVSDAYGTNLGARSGGKSVGANSILNRAGNAASGFAQSPAANYSTPLQNMATKGTMDLDKSELRSKARSSSQTLRQVDRRTSSVLSQTPIGKQIAQSGGEAKAVGKGLSSLGRVGVGVGAAGAIAGAGMLANKFMNTRKAVQQVSTMRKYAPYAAAGVGAAGIGYAMSRGNQ